jgi:RNA polymerase sigma-70 factor (ECF subfamily)
LNLCFYEDFSNQEAAEAMGIRLKALQSLLMRAKQTLREKFQMVRREDLV